MCPVCLANLAFITAGATSTSGLAALAVKKFFSKSNQLHQTNQPGQKQDENRDIGTKDRQSPRESFQSGIRS
jgi:hypothetical protein